MKRSLRVKEFNKTIDLSSSNFNSINANKNDFNNLVDAVELKWEICPDSFSKIIKIANEDDDVDTEEWNTYIYDTLSFDLNKSEMALRIREYTSKFKSSPSKFKSSLKQIYTPSDYISNQDSVTSFACEGDYTGNRQAIGCSIEGAVTTIQNAFSEEQENILQNRFNLSIANLTKFGPVKTTRFIFKKKNLHSEDLKVEIYETRTGVKFVEFSTRIKKKITNYLDVYKSISKWLSQNKINVCRGSKSKPQLIMEEELKMR